MRERDEEAAYERRMEQRMEYAEELAEQRRSRRARGCWCGLDGIATGICPGADRCPYSGYDEEVEK